MPRRKLTRAEAELRQTDARKGRPLRGEFQTAPIGPWREGPTEPAKVWTELVRAAPPGVLTRADRHALELATRMIVTMRTTGTTAALAAQLANVLGRLGLTPTARRTLSAPPEPPDVPDPRYAEFLT